MNTFSQPMYWGDKNCIQPTDIADVGYVPGNNPAAEHENYFRHQTYICLLELQRLAERMSAQIEAIEGCVRTYDLPDVDGDGIVSTGDAALIQTAATNIGAGNASGLTEAQEIAADADGDGRVSASDAALVLEFAANVGAGNYANDVKGWNAFMTDKNVKTVYGIGIRQIIALSQEEYDALETPDSQTLYIIRKKEAAV